MESDWLPCTAALDSAHSSFIKSNPTVCLFPTPFHITEPLYQKHCSNQMHKVLVIAKPYICPTQIYTPRKEKKKIVLMQEVQCWYSNYIQQSFSFRLLYTKGSKKRMSNRKRAAGKSGETLMRTISCRWVDCPVKSDISVFGGVDKCLLA